MLEPQYVASGCSVSWETAQPRRTLYLREVARVVATWSTVMA